MSRNDQTFKTANSMKGGMKRFTALFCGALLLLFASVMVNAQNDEKSKENPKSEEDVSSCVSCHLSEIDEDNTDMVNDYLKGVHARRGVDCADCHGGDPTAEDEEEAMDEDIGFLGAPEREDIPAFCANCHADPGYMRGFDPNISTDQYSKYLISGHGKRLTEDEDEKVAVCTSCHGVHGILPSDDLNSPVYATNIPATCANCHSDKDYMADRDIPTDQFSEYETSVHGKMLLEDGDPAAPSCTGCHGSHEARIPDKSGATNTCAQCHNFTRELFVASPHSAPFEENGFTECEVCHGNHAIPKTNDLMLSSGDGGVCGTCHEDNSAGMNAAAKMRLAIATLKREIDTVSKGMELARSLGMDVEEAHFKIREAKDELIKSRTFIHTFDPDKVLEATVTGTEVAKKAGVAVGEALEMYDFRKRGFIFSVIVILLLSVMLTLKIRSVDKKYEKHNEKRSEPE